MQAHANAVCFGAVIDQTLFEPRMLERLLRRETVLGVVDKDALQQVKELTVERGIGGNKFLLNGQWNTWWTGSGGDTYGEAFHRFDILPRCTSRLIVRVVEFASVEIPGIVSL